MRKRQTILMACTQPYWSDLQVGSQHLARQFADHGWEVYYFSSPITFFHLMKFRSNEARKRIRFAFDGPTKHYNNMITSFIPLSILSPLTFPVFKSTFIIENWHKTIIKSLKNKYIKNKKNKFDLLYIDNIFYYFLLTSIRYSKSIFRVMDVHSEFSGWNMNVEEIAKRIAKNSNITIYSAKGLKKYISRLYPEKAFLIPNGVDFSFFKKDIKYKKRGKHHILKNIPDPIVLYVGMIDTRVDFQLIKTTAQKLPEISFVFAGPFSEGIRPQNLPDNIYFLGSFPHKEIPHLMSSAKAGLIPFNIKKQMGRIEGIRPLKLFEYFAAGIPVISSRWPELEEMDSPAWLYDDEESFITFVNKAVNKSHETDIFQSFSEGHDWKNKFDLFMNYLNSSN